ncbi:MAG: type I-C CRISPR-associated protein Cas8c/Csd1 [Paludisphaera borealis]|uniref:type I-C CRISPR-associated protein Cas8c/Csd1 n=1 Tax=Paludisphaera borealis TaxID=1387353 RepID=UPI0028453E6F|nr:type I-C CRISPR-associated protein Cas8c/Csd1 [Paludisphaera borealis]MDR3618731.1 type I-C CRISPR-associated protein Cas8c/Csd1 [Paludisphaera borealis]
MLHALLQYAHDRRLAVEPGFKSKKVRWLLIFALDGVFRDVHRLEGDGDDGQLINGAPDLSQPELKGGGAGCRHFLVDNLEVVTLWTKGEADDKLAAKHAYFVDLLEQAANAEPRLGPIAASLKSESILERIHKELTASGSPKPKPTDNATVAILDADMTLHRIVDLDSWRPWWRGFRAKLGDKKKDKRPTKRKPTSDASDESETSLMRCLLSGANVEPVSTHGTIQGLADVGGQSSGDRFASFKQGSFTSYGLQQAANAAMSEDMAATYTAALNDLLLNHAERLAGAKVVYWYTGQVPPELDPVHSVKEPIFRFEDEEEDDEDLEGTPLTEDEANARAESDRPQIEARAGSLLRAIQDADRKDLLGYRYQALTLSANSGRVVVRDWMEGRFEQLAVAVDEWFDDLRIIARDGESFARKPKFLAVLGCLVRDLKDISRPIETALWRSAIGGRSAPIPLQAVAMALDRIRVDIIKDAPPSHARHGLLRAYCIRCKDIVMKPDLDEECSDPAYVSGRILAILGEIQYAANPNVGVGVVQRYYGAASTTPALVLGRLAQLANKAHLPQIKGGLQQWFDQRLTDAWSKLKEAPPHVLSLEEQTLFALGFYHQKAQRGKADKTTTAKED